MPTIKANIRTLDELVAMDPDELSDRILLVAQQNLKDGAFSLESLMCEYRGTGIEHGLIEVYGAQPKEIEEAHRAVGRALRVLLKKGLIAGADLLPQSNFLITELGEKSLASK